MAYILLALIYRTDDHVGRMAVRRIRPIAWLVALAGALVSAMSVAAYTGAQSAAGQQVYRVCAFCHGPTLQGAMGPALATPAFRATWQSAAALFQYISQNMPLNAPGSLKPGQYWDLVAFLLQRNGVEPDEQPLDERTAAQVKLGQAQPTRDP